jgi:transcriptional regulator with XRE-family HTH domain
MGTFAQRLARAFSEGDYTQAELARQAKVSRPSVSDWFSGETRTLKAEPLVRAAKYLGVQALWLATGEGPMRSTEQAAAIGKRSIAEPEPAYGRPAWPFPVLSEDEVCALPRDQILRLEGAILGAAETLGLSVKQPASLHG